jgi:hypothetical protein
MYIINNYKEYISKKREKIDEAISQNNYKDAFIIFVTTIPHLKDQSLISEFVNYYEEMVFRKFVPVAVSNPTESSSSSYIIRSRI